MLRQAYASILIAALTFTASHSVARTEPPVAIDPNASVAFTERPEDILASASAYHPDFMSPRLWDSLRDGTLVTAKFLSAYYSNDVYTDIYILVRDPILVGYAWQLMEPGERRVHFLGVSRASVVSSLLRDYLEQEGLSEAALAAKAAAGKRVLILDSGFQMSLGRRIAGLFGQSARSALRFQLNRSAVPDIPETATMLYREVEELAPIRLSDLVKKLAELPKTTGRVRDFVRRDDRLSPVAFAGNDPNDGITSVIDAHQVRLMLEDLKARSEYPEFRETLNAIGNAVTHWKTLAGAGVPQSELMMDMRAFEAAAAAMHMTRAQASLITGTWTHVERFNPFLPRSLSLIASGAGPTRLDRPQCERLLSPRLLRR